MPNASDIGHDIGDAFPALAGRDVIVFDGVCVLCAGSFAFVVRHDRAQRFSFVVAQSPLGERLYEHFGLRRGDLKQDSMEGADYETNLVLIDGRLYQKLDAFAAVMARLGWPWRLLAAVRYIPAPLGNWLYDRVARNRYRLFGRRDTCLVPSPALKARFLE